MDPAPLLFLVLLVGNCAEGAPARRFSAAYASSSDGVCSQHPPNTTQDAKGNYMSRPFGLVLTVLILRAWVSQKPCWNCYPGGRSNICMPHAGLLSKQCQPTIS